MAEPVTLSLVIPTIGRPTLARCLTSVRRQEWRAGDEVLLVGDGPQSSARELWDQFGLPGSFHETPDRIGFWGHGIRNRLLDLRAAKGTHLVALDDDDELADGAVATVRAAIDRNPDRPHLFRMSGEACRGLVWRTREIAHGNVGTPMLVAPNDPARLGRYALHHGGDCDFIRETCNHYRGGPVWREEVVCLVRPAPPPAAAAGPR